MKSAADLRVLAANHIKSNAENFLAFLESDIDSYCHKVIVILPQFRLIHEYAQGLFATSLDVSGIGVTELALFLSAGCYHILLLAI